MDLTPDDIADITEEVETLRNKMIELGITNFSPSAGLSAFAEAFVALCKVLVIPKLECIRMIEVVYDTWDEEKGGVAYIGPNKPT